MSDEERQPVNVRRAALETLVESVSASRFIDDVLADRIVDFGERDRRLLQEICYGSVRHRNTLDHLLRMYLKLAVASQRPPIGWALRIGAYQLVYLGRIPAHAAVNQTLEGLKSIDAVRKKDVGFVNAVLHKLVGDIVRKQPEPPEEGDDPNVLPIRKGFCHFSRPVLPLVRLDPVEHFCVKYSHPRWLVGRWLKRFGEEETRAFLDANNATPVPTARVTRRAPSPEALAEKLAEEGFEIEAGPIEGTLRILHGEVGRSAAFADGWFQMQDTTATRIGAVLDPPPVARVLDLCSAPGGKAAQLLEKLDDGGQLVATDRNESKLERLRENLDRVGGDFRVVVTPEDPAQIDLGERFTHILVDAPCSNTGVLARRPDARWRIQREDLNSLTALQAGLLEAALRHLEPGGRLVYATCSVEPAENEERVAQLMSDHPDLTEIETKLFLPHRADGDGGFYSLLRKGL